MIALLEIVFGMDHHIPTNYEFAKSEGSGEAVHICPDRI